MDQFLLLFLCFLFLSGRTHANSSSSSNNNNSNNIAQEVVIVTNVKDETHFGYKNLYRTVKHFGYQWKLLKEEEEEEEESNTDDNNNNNDGSISFTNTNQLISLKNTINEIENENTLIMVVEAYNTLFQRGPKELMSLYEKHSANIIFASERTCRPHEEDVSKDICEEGNLVRSTFLGSAISIRQLIDEYLRYYEKSTTSEQEEEEEMEDFFSMKLAQQSDDYDDNDSIKIDVDVDGQFFQTLNNVGPSEWKVVDGFDSEDEDSNGYMFVHNITQTKPIVLHGNAQSKYTLLGIGNYIAGAYNKEKGTLHHMPTFTNLSSSPSPSSLSSNDVIYPLSVGIFFLGTPFEKEFFDSVLSLLLDWTQVHMYVRYDPNSRFHIDDNTKQMFKSFHILDPNDADCTARASFLSSVMNNNNNEQPSSFALTIDSDVILEHNTTVQDLASWNESLIIGHARRKKVMWSNYWTNMRYDGFYAKGFDTKDIYAFNRTGLWQVPFGRSLMLFRSDVISSFYQMYQHNGEKHGSSCDRLVSIDAMDKGIAMYADNRERYATLMADIQPVNPSAPFPELYEAHTNPTLWEKRYLLPDYKSIPLQEVCQDAFGAVIFTPQFCQDLIETTEQNGNWSSGQKGQDDRINGYENHPTRDIHMFQFQWQDQWAYILKYFFTPIVKKYYQHAAFDAEMNFAFVVKYSMEGQRKLETHTDASAYTTTVLLNSEFEGGGVEFTRYNCTTRATSPGFFLVHPGRMTHAHKAHPITAGKRYVIVSFNE